MGEVHKVVVLVPVQVAERFGSNDTDTVYCRFKRELGYLDGDSFCGKIVIRQRRMPVQLEEIVGIPHT